MSFYPNMSFPQTFNGGFSGYNQPTFQTGVNQWESQQTNPGVEHATNAIIANSSKVMKITKPNTALIKTMSRIGLIFVSIILIATVLGAYLGIKGLKQAISEWDETKATLKSGTEQRLAAHTARNAPVVRDAINFLAQNAIAQWPQAQQTVAPKAAPVAQPLDAEDYSA